MEFDRKGRVKKATIEHMKEELQEAKNGISIQATFLKVFYHFHHCDPFTNEFEWMKCVVLRTKMVNRHPIVLPMSLFALNFY